LECWKSVFLPFVLFTNPKRPRHSHAKKRLAQKELKIYSWMDGMGRRDCNAMRVGLLIMVVVWAGLSVCLSICLSVCWREDEPFKCMSVFCGIITVDRWMVTMCEERRIRVKKRVNE